MFGPSNIAHNLNSPDCDEEVAGHMRTEHKLFDRGTLICNDMTCASAFVKNGGSGVIANPRHHMLRIQYDATSERMRRSTSVFYHVRFGRDYGLRASEGGSP